MATFTGTSAGNSITGTRYADTIHSLGGNDFVLGGNGNDTISAGTGDDWVNGGSGSDQIAGGSGADTLIGDGGDIDHPVVAGADRIYGEAGDDSISGDGGNDFLSGGDGNDTIDGGAGQDRMSGGNGGDYLVDTVATAWGDAGDDQLAIGAGSAHGGGGNDVFQVNYSAQETVTWTGGTGADIFLASFYTNDGHVERLTIADFNPAEGDQIRLQEDDQPSGYHADQAAVLAAEDTNHDGKLSALQADGTGDRDVSLGTDGLSIHWSEDTVTIAHLSAIDLSMFG